MVANTDNIRQAKTITNLAGNLGILFLEVRAKVFKVGLRPVCVCVCVRGGWAAAGGWR